MFLKPGDANTDPIGYGESQNSITFLVTSTKAVFAMGNADLTGGIAEVTVPITNWDEYHGGWGLGNSVSQLVIETFLVHSREVHLRWVHREEGETALPLISFAKKDPVYDFVCPALPALQDPTVVQRRAGTKFMKFKLVYMPSFSIVGPLY